MPNVRPRIVLCFPVHEEHVSQIREAAPEWDVINAGQEGVAKEILTADIFCGHAKVPVPWAEVVERNRLKWIQSSAAGMDHCLVPEVINSSIPVSSASGLFAQQVAEQTMALLTGMLRSMPVFHRAQEKREFIRRPTDDLHGKTVGIVGLGGNGRRIAETLAPMRVRTIATDFYPVQRPDYVEELWPAEELPRLLQAADIVILCVPLNAQTARMMGAEQFALMKKGAYLVNVARGQVVDEPALVEALRQDRLRGAALDVTAEEPLPTESPLWEMPQVTITPHVGAQSADRVDVTVDFFCENLHRFCRDQRLFNCVDKQLGFPHPNDRTPA
ncbi:MAG: phosphoglycerate dehydrogenase [Planctomycetaceae bacterium]|nr:phosphoglycerate dehydrogenase [Planctomycetaceae bacterium]